MDYTTNKESRAKLRNDPHSVLSYINRDINIVVKTNTKDTIYVAFPVAGDNIDTEELSKFSAAGTVSTVGTLGSAGTLGTISSPATFGSVSSGGTVGTTGSAGG